MKVDFVKLFIVEELLYYISKSVNLLLFRTKESKNKWPDSANSTTKTMMKRPLLLFRPFLLEAETISQPCFWKD